MSFFFLYLQPQLWTRRRRYTYRNDDTKRQPFCFDLNCRWYWRNGIASIAFPFTVLQIVHLAYYSTITYDTLVRAGISCTSAYVSSDPTANPPSSSAFSPTNLISSSAPIISTRGSRGIRILADEYFSEKFCSGVIIHVFYYISLRKTENILY